MKHIIFFLAVMLLTGCSKDSEVMAQTMTQKMYITIDGKTLSVELVAGRRRHPLQRQPDRALLWIKLMELHPSGAYGVFIAGGIGVFPQSRTRECHSETVALVGRNGYQRHPKHKCCRWCLLFIEWPTGGASDEGIVY